MTGPDPGSRALENDASQTPRARELAGVDRLLDAAEVAELLGVPERWVRDHTRLGRIPHVRLGRYVRYRWTSVEEWVLDQEEGGTGRRGRPRRAGGT